MNPALVAGFFVSDGGFLMPRAVRRGTANEVRQGRRRVPSAALAESPCAWSGMPMPMWSRDDLPRPQLTASIRGAVGKRAGCTIDRR